MTSLKELSANLANTEKEGASERELATTNNKGEIYEPNKQDLKPLNLSASSNEGKKIKFFGFKFMTIWMFPMATLGIVMEFLFISPIRGTTPFN